MKKLYLVAAVLVLVLSWLFVGLDRYVGDHEAGGGWDLFIKHKPSMTVFFSNPAQFGLDMAPLDKMDDGAKKDLVEYCKVRYGTDNMSRCYELFQSSRV
ncbi:hypothetical protein [Collimonas humicola]|uniref:hypothetical protein n=1 Tax=Collimonas humicola TaxID=2825886 RepID=UPI001B8BF3F2|nr:hypothetical protein [Collimonas humicola]